MTVVIGFSFAGNDNNMSQKVTAKTFCDESKKSVKQKRMLSLLHPDSDVMIMSSLGYKFGENVLKMCEVKTKKKFIRNTKTSKISRKKSPNVNKMKKIGAQTFSTHLRDLCYYVHYFKRFSPIF
jgi:hypothetical protein